MEKDPHIVISGEISQRHLDALYQILQNQPKKIVIILKSKGGSASVAVQIVNLLKKAKNEGVEIQTHGSMYVCSSAFLIFLQGDKRFHNLGTIFKIDLPYKVEKELLLGYPESEIKLKKLLQENETIMEGRKQWIDEIISKTNLSSDDVIRFDENGKQISEEEVVQFGICKNEK